MQTKIQWPGQVNREFLPTEGAVYDGDTVHAFAWLSGTSAGRIKVRVDRGDNGSAEDILQIEEMDEGVASGEAGHPIARMAAAALVAGQAPDARDLALEYQLLTQFTDFLVVHERVEEEKATEMPALRTVTGMLAAGWGGVVTVANRKMSLSMKYSAEPMMCMADSAAFDEPEIRSSSNGSSSLSSDREWDQMIQAIEREIEFDYGSPL